MALVCQKKKRSSLLHQVYNACLNNPGIESERGELNGFPFQRNNEAVAVVIVVAISGHSDQTNFPRLRQLLLIRVQIRMWEKRVRVGNQML